MANVFSFEDLMASIQDADAVVSQGSKSGFSGVFGINKAKVQLTYGPNKDKTENQIVLLVKVGAGFKMSWIQNPLYLSRKGVKNDSGKKFTTKEFQDLLGRLKSKSASEDDALYAHSWNENFIAVKSYLLNIVESFYNEIGKKGKGASGSKFMALCVKAGLNFDMILQGAMSLFPKGESILKGHEKLGYMADLPSTKAMDMEVFLQYQWSFSKGQKKTYPEIPKATKGTKQGLVFHPITEGYTVVEGEDTFTSINEQGDIHPIQRSEWFMSSNYGSQQIIGGEDSIFDDAPKETQANGWGDFETSTDATIETPTTGWI